MFIELEAMFVIVAESPEDTTKLVTARLPIVAESAVAVVLAISPVTETPVAVVASLLALSWFKVTAPFSTALTMTSPVVDARTTWFALTNKPPVPTSFI